MGDQRDRLEVVEPDADDLDARGAAVRRDHNLAADQRRGVGDAGHRGEPPRVSAS